MSRGKVADLTQDSVSKIAARVQLEAVRLRYVTAVLGARSASDVPNSWADELRTHHEANVVLDPEPPGEESLSSDLTVFVVSASFRLAYWGDEEPPQDNDEALPDVGIAAVFELTYQLKSSEGLVHRDLVVFAAQNAVFNAWPYWRELAHSTTVRMGLKNPLVVPVLTVNALLAHD